MRMRTSVDIPDALLIQVRGKLKAQGRTLRDAILEGLRLVVLDEPERGPFRLRDATFPGEPGFADGFSAADLTAAIREDAETRMAAEPDVPYQP